MSILNAGDEAFIGPDTEIVYRPAVVTPSKSIGWTKENVPLHVPRLAGTVPVATVVLFASFTLNVAPVSSTLDIRYARFDAPTG